MDPSCDTIVSSVAPWHGLHSSCAHGQGRLTDSTNAADENPEDPGEFGLSVNSSFLVEYNSIVGRPLVLSMVMAMRELSGERAILGGFLTLFLSRE